MVDQSVKKPAKKAKPRDIDFMTIEVALGVLGEHGRYLEREDDRLDKEVKRAHARISDLELALAAMKAGEK